MSFSPRRTVLLVQLPIPPLGPAPIRGNVPLAAAYLKLFAESRGLGRFYDIGILPVNQANALGDRALVAALAERDPWLVGFTCYLWNIDRTLWIARELKRLRPDVYIVFGGPEITPDNAWILESADYDFAVIGEGEQTFAELLTSLIENDIPSGPIAGLYVPPFPRRTVGTRRYDPSRRPAFRVPMPDLNELGSPYLAGILDAAEDKMLLLETTRGCVFKCKFCYYPKSYDRQYYLAYDQIMAGLRHADERGASEVFLLDPTLNQRKDFAELLGVLARGNPGRRFTYFGELRGEGITEQTARLLREANFTEVEVGLQSIDPDAQEMMERKNNLKAFERGVRAMLRDGISVKVDMIIGLPGDTVESVRRGLHYLRDNGLYNDVQVFNLSILPGTAFRHESAELGLSFQPRPPYYVLNTPTLDRAALFELMHEAQELFDIEFDAQPAPVLEFAPLASLQQVWRVDLDQLELAELSSPGSWAQAFTVWLRSANFEQHRTQITAVIHQVLEANPFTTLQVVLEMKRESSCSSLRPRTLAGLLAECRAYPSYLDRYYAMQPGRPNGSKRLIVVIPQDMHLEAANEWAEELEEYATCVWRTSSYALCQGDFHCTARRLLVAGVSDLDGTT